MSLWIALIAWLGQAQAQDFHRLYAGGGVQAVAPLDKVNGQQSWVTVAPRLEATNLLLWGYAQAYMAASPWRGFGVYPLAPPSQTYGHLHGEAGLRFHLGGSLYDKDTVVWLGVGVVDSSYRITGGAQRSNLRMQHGLGLSTRQGPWLVHVGAGFVPFTSVSYPDARDLTDDFFFGGRNYSPWPLTLQVSVVRGLGTVYEPARRAGRVDPWFALGVGSTLMLGETDDRLMDDAFAGNHGPSAWFPQADLGLKLGDKGHGLLLSYRHLLVQQEAYGLERLWLRESLLLGWEWTPFSVVGLEPFASLGVTGDYLRFVQRDFELVTAAEHGFRAWPAGTVGVGYRPTKHPWLRARTQVRASPGLALSRSRPVEIGWSQLEWTLLALEVYPRRW